MVGVLRVVKDLAACDCFCFGQVGDCSGDFVGYYSGLSGDVLVFFAESESSECVSGAWCYSFDSV